MIELLETRRLSALAWIGELDISIEISFGMIFRGSCRVCSWSPPERPHRPNCSLIISKTAKARCGVEVVAILSSLELQGRRHGLKRILKSFFTPLPFYQLHLTITTNQWCWQIHIASTIIAGLLHFARRASDALVPGLLRCLPTAISETTVNSSIIHPKQSSETVSTRPTCKQKALHVAGVC